MRTLTNPQREPLSAPSVRRGAMARLTASMVLFGTIGLFVRSIPLPSALIALVRGLVGTVFLLGLSALSGRRPDGGAIRRRLPGLLLSGTCLGFNWILLFEAYRFTTVAIATLCYYLAPIFVILLSPLLLGERLGGRRLLCVGAALAGMVLVSGAVGTGGAGDIRGILLGLAAAILYASVVMLNKGMAGVGAYDRTMVQLGVSAAVLLPYVLLTQPLGELAPTPVGLALLLVVGVVHTGLAYALYFGSMEGLSAQTAALFSYIDPVVAILLSALVLGEYMGPLQWLGAVLVLGATLVGERYPARTKKNTT